MSKYYTHRHLGLEGNHSSRKWLRLPLYVYAHSVRSLCRKSNWELVPEPKHLKCNHALEPLTNMSSFSLMFCKLG